ncbi:MAG: GWxTD domain-containing protein [Balneolaceae bacterium]
MNVTRTLLLILLLMPATALESIAQENDWLERGREAELQGEPVRALEIWKQAIDSLKQPNAAIGFEFIRLATLNEFREYYPDATVMYYWALSEPFYKNNRAFIKQEIERLKPLTGNGIYRQWIKWWNDSDERLGADMKGYWIQLDPTPSEIHNERLTEHWRRIAVVSSRFKKNRRTIFNADDRAIPYIRYGEPDRKENGRLIFQIDRVGEWLQRQIEIATRTDPDRDRFIETSLDDTRERLTIESVIQPFQTNPEFEVWIYDRVPTQDNKPLIFVFGSDHETGEFRLHSSIDDLIPERAFFPGRRDDVFTVNFVRQGLSPAFMLQMMYYEQLAGVDDYFHEQLKKMMEMLIEQTYSPAEEMDLQARSNNRDILRQREISAPQYQFDLDEVMTRIPVQVYQYRFLDEDNNPYLVNFIESRPADALMEDFSYNYTEGAQVEDAEKMENYRVNHALQIFDNQWEIVHQFNESHKISRDMVQSDEILQSVFRIPHDKKRYVTGSVQLINPDPGTAYKYESLFPPELRGLGNRRLRQPTPLRSDPNNLEVADLVLGYNKIDSNDLFPFTVANDGIIPLEETLVLHFEVYNLQRKLSGFTEFELTYRIFPVDEFGIVITDQQEFILTLNFGSEDTRVIEDLEIQTASLPAGLYELHVFIMDSETLQELNRRMRFEVIDLK